MLWGWAWRSIRVLPDDVETADLDHDGHDPGDQGRERLVALDQQDRHERGDDHDGSHPHELRHTAASLAIASGADVKVVQLMLGHKTATMTLDLYGHLFPDKLDELADRLDDAVCPGSAPAPTPDDEEGDQ